MVIVPFLLWGATENARRVFWVALILSLLVIFVMSPARRWKRSFMRFLMVAAPVFVIYVAAGWSSGSAIFAPVRTIRSVVEPQSDRSSYWREVENWNIAMSMRAMPLTGLGLGGEYTEVMPNDSVAEAYREYREWPHNSFLGILLLLGPLGFTAVLSVTSVATFLAVRSHRLSTAPEHRVGALAIVVIIMCSLVLAWGDLGSAFPQYNVLVALAVSGVALLAPAVVRGRRTPTFTCRAMKGQRSRAVAPLRRDR